MSDTNQIKFSWYGSGAKNAALEVFRHYPGTSAALGASSVDNLLFHASFTDRATAPKLILAHTGDSPIPETVLGAIGFQYQTFLTGCFTLGGLCVVERVRGQKVSKLLIENAIKQITGQPYISDLRSVTVLLEQGGTSNRKLYEDFGFKPLRNDLMVLDIPNPRFTAS